jgi:hypothetical protein
MCTCITHTRARACVSHFTRYYRVTCDLRHTRSRRGMVCLMSSLFLSCVFYYWLILPHLDCHINHDWLHVERFQGRFLEFGQIEYEIDWILQYIQETSCIREFSNGSFDSLKTDSLSVAPFLCLDIPSSAVQRIEGERCRTTACALPSTCSSSTISSSIHARDPL